MKLSVEHRTKIVQLFFETKSFKATARLFNAHYGLNRRDAPRKSTILRIVRRFKGTGSVSDTHRPGRPKTARSPENIKKADASIKENSKKSVRRRSQEMGLSKSSLSRILLKDLNLHPYKTQTMQTLSDSDKEARKEMCLWMKERLVQDDHWADRIWFSDEAHFYLANRQNCRVWSQHLPSDINEKPLHSPKCTAWCAFSAQGIIGPFWFETEQENPTTITKENYQAVFNKFLAQLRQRRLRFEDQWFQQDGAAPHRAKSSMETVTEAFGNRVIALGTENKWAPRSPDLSPLDFFLWGYCKDTIYHQSPSSIHDLKKNIENCIRSIPSEMCQKVINNFKKRLDMCIKRNGCHIEHLQF